MPVRCWSPSETCMFFTHHLGCNYCMSAVLVVPPGFKLTPLHMVINVFVCIFPFKLMSSFSSVQLLLHAGARGSNATRISALPPGRLARAPTASPVVFMFVRCLCLQRHPECAEKHVVKQIVHQESFPPFSPAEHGSRCVRLHCLQTKWNCQ
jgi:hypothetical protein